jgi:hypothetical protein
MRPNLLELMSAHSPALHRPPRGTRSAALGTSGTTRPKPVQGQPAVPHSAGFYPKRLRASARSASCRAIRAGRGALPFALVLALATCRRSASEPTPATTGVSVDPMRRSELPAQPSWPEAPYRFSAPRRLVAIGDLHGDLGAARRALELGGAVDRADRWIGGSLVVVQTGDVLDRGDDEREILSWFADLGRQAERSGGALHVLQGNHEVMNVEGDFRYVTPGGVADFADVTVDPGRGELLRFPPSLRPRAAAFLPGGPWARRLSVHPTVAIVGRTAFAHGGIGPGDVGLGVGRINGAVTAWMRGLLPNLPPALRGEDTPFWTRRYSGAILSDDTCRTLGELLVTLGADRLVIGHTVQPAIGSACGGKLWRIDVGLSKAYGSRALEVLEIQGERVEVLRENQATESVRK